MPCFRKHELLAVTANVWSDIFTCDTSPHEDDEKGFDGYIKRTFENARAGMKRYPGFLPAHVLDQASKQDQRTQGREMMRSFFGHIENGMIRALDADKRVRQDAFTGDLTREGFAELVTQQLVVLLILGKDSCGSLVSAVQRVLY